MNKHFKNIFLPLLRKYGLDLVQYHPHGYEEETPAIYDSVRNYTMTSQERVDAVIKAVKYIETYSIDGALVECGVWKGGSIMAMALTLKYLGNMERDIYLYDTFSGMNSPTENDVMYDGTFASWKFYKTRISNDSSTWCSIPMETVKSNILDTGYPEARIHFIKGTVENTIPGIIPDKIALLRLDTDWYESTKHELTHLYPLLSPKGVIIIDDYGHWQGAKKAVDEYIRDNNLCLLLNRIDYTGMPRDLLTPP
jgi:hypothetical protein